MPASPSPADSPDSRPRPQYGEYATAEEQRARIRRPDASDALSAGHAPNAVAVAQAPVGRRALAGGADEAPAPATGRRVDVIMTLVLLGLGFLHVLLVAPMLFVFDRVIVFMLDYNGLDSAGLTDTTDLRLAGVVAASAMIFFWLVAAGASWWSLRRRRLSFWIPLAAAFLASVAVNLLLDGPISREPLITELLNQVMGMTAGG